MDRIANKRQKASTGKRNAQAALVAIITLALTGCETAPPSPKANVTPPPRVEARGSQELAATPKQPQVPPKPALPAVRQPAAYQPAAQQPGPRSEPKPVAAIASKGAEKLSAPNAPAATAVTRTPVARPQLVESQARIAQTPAPATSAPVAELIVKGSPRPEQPKSGGKKVLIWVTLGIGGAVLAILVSLSVVRRPQPVKVHEGKKLDPMREDGLLMKEPLNQP